MMITYAPAITNGLRGCVATVACRSLCTPILFYNQLITGVAGAYRKLAGQEQTSLQKINGANTTFRGKYAPDNRILHSNSLPLKYAHVLCRQDKTWVNHAIMFYILTQCIPTA